MKNLIILLVLTFTVTGALIAQPGDSILTKKDTTNAKVYREDDDDDDDVKVKIGVKPSGKQHRISTRWVMLDMGINTYLYEGSANLPTSLDPFELNYGKSIHWTLRVYEQRFAIDSKRHFALSHGVNFEWMQYNLVNDYKLLEGEPVVTPVLHDEPLRNNRLTTSMVTLPIQLHYETRPGRLRKSFHVSAGAFGSVMLGSAQYMREDDGQRLKSTDDFNLNRFRMGIVGKVGYGPITFYTSYSMTPLFKAGEGPELMPIQFGISLLPF